VGKVQCGVRLTWSSHSPPDTISTPAIGSACARSVHGQRTVDAQSAASARSSPHQVYMSLCTRPLFFSSTNYSFPFLAPTPLDCSLGPMSVAAVTDPMACEVPLSHGPMSAQTNVCVSRADQCLLAHLQSLAALTDQCLSWTNVHVSSPPSLPLPPTNQCLWFLFIRCLCTLDHFFR